ncbi:DnaB-like helicase N-terminal domain-containing protein [Rhodococcus sp. H29-C3]|uniref:DnaB-like helicase N-terminal domain-containing protein n=1 Tax=Rhodococcus sp. H29-C3 TaxID=3046307 RepID=UPI0024BADE1F|nr:DnaB-like helicase N-terminal domain-containing protein [Rhodococcus sp. H29-C3]MDJ0363134.1 DnaB-like helicase N-terminal domain-containing protein [Rhodococcus sp. H29-C3]
MTALRAVPTPDSGVGTLDRVDGAEITYDLGTDPEALLLCTLMWSYHPAGDVSETARITAALTAADFDDAAHGRLYAIVAELVAAAEPFDVAAVTNTLVRSGAAGQKDAPLRRRLVNITTLGTHPLTATNNAAIVLSQSYRRSFRIAGHSIVQAAEELPEDDLFEQMLECGRRQRRAHNRLHAFRSGVEAVRRIQ